MFRTEFDFNFKANKLLIGSSALALFLILDDIKHF
jgi:hypothetical protein